MQNTLVMKFGGASVATPHHFSQIAQLVILKRALVDRIAIVVSAMGNTTDQLIALAKEIHPNPPRREYDMLVTVGERISIALLAMALSLKNQEAVSFTGSQSGIITTTEHTEAKIVNVKPKRILEAFQQGKIVIVAGFQGVSLNGEITTLGRGGSDTTAVALGVALKASHVEFYKDVGGIYQADPKTDPSAQRFDDMSYNQAKMIVERGAKILHGRCLDLAQKNQLPLLVRSFVQGVDTETWIRDPLQPPIESNIYEI